MTLAIIQARLGSTRFPRKALAELNGIPLTEHVVRRAREIQGVDRVVLAVPVQDYPDFRFDWAPVYGFFGIEESDVLGRFARAAEREPNADTIMRLTGDCPMLDPRIAEQVLALYHADPHVEYASNVAPGYIDGTDVEVFSRSALLWAARSATAPSDREHVTPWLRRNVKCATLAPAFDAKGLKTSIDTPGDLDRVRALMAVTA